MMVFEFKFTFETVIEIIVMASVVSVIMAVLINFLLDEENHPVKKGRRSIVATGTMFGFFLVYYLVLRLGLGAVKMQKNWLYYAIVILGAVMIVAGALINILGRLKLKNNWADHIKIYQNHTLVMDGVFGLVRHPLYSSLMLAFFGGALVYRNWVSGLLNAGVFIPFMYYRAKQEEDLLEKEFEGYREYKRRVGMFFPKIGGRNNG